MNRIACVTIALSLFLSDRLALADVLIVPSEFSSIQAAIDAAQDGDEVLVIHGMYFESIDLLGKAITLKSVAGAKVTTIDANGSGSVVTCTSGETPKTIIDGFTITGGDGTVIDGFGTTAGGGFYIVSSSPTIMNCIIDGNSALQAPSPPGAPSGEGAGVWVTDGQPMLIDCVISNNAAEGPTAGGGGGLANFGSDSIILGCSFISNRSAIFGAGMFNENCSPVIMDCEFIGNHFNFGPFGAGAGIDNEMSSPVIDGCYFERNIANDGGGIRNNVFSHAQITNCEFIGNEGRQTGGGIGSRFCEPTIVNCTFIENTASIGAGAAIHNVNAGNIGQMFITHCTFTGNHAGGGLVGGELDPEKGAGGAIFNSGSDPIITDCEFTDNISSDMAPLGGGGVCNVGTNQAGESTMIERCTFSGNTSVRGGGVYNFVSDLLIIDCEFTLNTALRGAALYGQELADTMVMNCSFDSNAAVEWGGAVAHLFFSAPVLSDCSFVNNDAQFGGAVYGQQGGDTTLINCALEHNTATHSGGGVFHFLETASVLVNCALFGNEALAVEKSGGLGGAVANLAMCQSSIINCSIVNNIAESEGGAVHNQDDVTVTIVNSILWNNGSDQIAGNALPDVRYSIVQGGFAGREVFDVDPLFEDETSNDLHLQPGSPAIDAGDNAALPSDVETDLGGQPRLADDPATEDSGLGNAPIVDLGAYEFHGVSCLADLTHDGEVGFDDLLLLLKAWNEAASIADIDGSGVVGFEDLLLLLRAWGPCDPT